MTTQKHWRAGTIRDTLSKEAHMHMTAMHTVSTAPFYNVIWLSLVVKISLSTHHRQIISAYVAYIFNNKFKQHSSSKQRMAKTPKTCHTS